MVKDRVTPDAAFLPKEALSVVAWVRIDEPTEWGAYPRLLPGQRPVRVRLRRRVQQEEVLLRPRDRTPTKKLTYLESKTEYVRGKWYHVAAVYDGKQMRLYVNGQLDATSDEQSGPILYAKAAPFVIGRYQDDDEDYPMHGAIKEVMLCPHAVAADQVAAHFEADKALAEAPSVIPARPAIRRRAVPAVRHAHEHHRDVGDGRARRPRSSNTARRSRRSSRRRSRSPTRWARWCSPNLEPNTKYFYRVVCTDAEGRKLEGKPLTFMTAPGPADAFSFAVIGDTQRNPVVTGKVAKLMWERRPNFVVHCGDVVDDGAAKWQWTGDLFKPCNELFGRVAVFPCIGNHEKNHAALLQVLRAAEARVLLLVHVRQRRVLRARHQHQAAT